MLHPSNCTLLGEASRPVVGGGASEDVLPPGQFHRESLCSRWEPYRSVANWLEAVESCGGLPCHKALSSTCSVPHAGGQPLNSHLNGLGATLLLGHGYWCGGAAVDDEEVAALGTTVGRQCRR